MVNNKKVISIGLGLLLIFIIMLIILSLSTRISSVDNNKEALHTVINHIFSCPDEEMMVLYKDMNKAVEEKIASLPNDTKVYTIEDHFYYEIDKKLEEIYAPFISPDWYEAFLGRFRTDYYIYSTAVGYECKVNRIEIIQSKTIPTNYSFIIYLNYGKEDKKKDIELKGSAQFAKEAGKISYIQFFTDREFQMEFMKANQELYK